LLQRGFERIGQLDNRLPVAIWWAQDRRLQVLLIRIGGTALLRGNKSYYLRSITRDGETWARDIPALHAYLETHFTEMRLAFSHWRDVPKEIAETEALRRFTHDAPATEVPTREQLDRLVAEARDVERMTRDDHALFSLAQRSSDLFTQYVRQLSASQRAGIDQRREALEDMRRRYDTLQQLQREYWRKGSAAVLTFEVGSNLQTAEDSATFERALHSVVDELIDYDRFQIRQKLQGGRLNVQVAEAQEPIWSWIEQWFGGALSPIQLQRIAAPEVAPVREPAPLSNLRELGAAVVFGHTDCQLEEYGADYDDLERQSTEMFILMDDTTHLLATDETAKMTWRRLTSSSRCPEQAYELAIRRFKRWSEAINLDEQRQTRMTALLSRTGLEAVLRVVDRELRDIAIETIIDRATSGTVRVGIVDDGADGKGSWIRQALDRFDSIRVLDHRVAVHRARGSLCRIIYGLTRSAAGAQIIRSDLELMRAAVACTIFPISDIPALVDFLRDQLSYDSTPLTRSTHRFRHA
jgi:hypothetical protein